jgi:hypothetical protein
MFRDRRGEDRRRAWHEAERRHRVGLAGVRADRRHQGEVVVLVPEPGPGGGVQVRNARSREDEREEAEQQREHATLRHGNQYYYGRFLIVNVIDDSTTWPSTDRTRNRTV